jgi:cytochrome b pre-mRNA-processing protein 3
MKRMAGAFYGRNKVYGEALAAGDAEALAAALARNAYREGGAVPRAAGALAERVLALARAFELVSLLDFAEGRFHYPKA